MPEIRRRSVDFPDPLAPISRHLDPLGNFKLRSFNVGARDLGSYENVRFSTQIAADSSNGGRVGKGFGLMAGPHMMLV